MLRVFYSDIAGLPDQPGSLTLSSYRLAQLSACRSPERRRQGIGAELLLIHALRSVKGDCPLPLSVEIEAGGKPYFPDDPLFFSLSHSGCTVACAISDRPVGVDLEGIRPLRETVLRRCFNEAEQRLILDSDDPAALFTELWTRKESFLKATGDGIRLLHSVDTINPTKEAAFFSSRIRDCSLSVCVPGAQAEPECLESVDLLKEFF